MKILIALALATTLFAEEEGKLEQLLSASGENVIKKIEEVSEYSSEELIIKNEEEAPEYACEEEDVVELLEEQKPAIENKNSLKGVIEKETAQVLQNQKEEQLPQEIEPQVEDLSLLVQRPTVTLAESPEKEEKLNSYEALPITFEEKQKIAKILITMAENNIFQLLFEKKHLERLGFEINHVHPIRFIGTVFSDPRLAHCMRRIKRSGFKWDGFMDGFSQRFREEIKANNINAYVPGLAESLNVKPEEIQAYVNNNDLEGLIIFLMGNANPNRE